MMSDTITTNDMMDAAESDNKRAYHSPEMTEHGKLALVTAGGAGSSFDGVGYSGPV